jgi:outer membrane protein, heavy metal efflux system
LLAELTFQNARIAEYNRRLAIATDMANVYKRKLETDESGILEFNKAQVHQLKISKDKEFAEIRRKALLAELSALNAGETILFADSIFSTPLLTEDFTQWFTDMEQNNPALQWLDQELSISKEQQKLQKSLNLPGFSAGYMSEKVTGQQFQGVTIGVTIPLWEHKNTLRYTSAHTEAIQAMQADAKLQFYNEMRALHAKTAALENSTASYFQALKQLNSSELLKKALDHGEISLGEYLIEMTLQYESMDQLLEMEYAWNLSYQELMKFR